MVKLLFSNHGLRGWLLQRASAIVMASGLAAIAVIIVLKKPDKYAAWKGMFGETGTKVAILLFFVGLLVHAWLGMQNILGDYVRNQQLRAYLLRLVLTMLAGYSVWLVVILCFSCGFAE